jgi:AAA domain-containing protein
MPPRVRTTARPATAPARPASAPRRPTAITSLQDHEAPRYRKWCVYGESDVGKTVLAGSAPKGLILSTDIEGTESAAAMGSESDVLQVNTFAEYVEYVDWIVRGSGKTEYEWVTTDTITELEELAWQEQMVNEDLKRASQYQPNKGDYPIVWKRVQEQLKLLARAPVNVLFVAHTMRVDRETEDGEDTVTLAMPAIGSQKRGDLSTKLCAQLGMVGYMRKVVGEDGKAERQLLTESSTRWIARDRSTTLGAGMVKPTVPALLAKMNAASTTAVSTTTRRRRGR